jgi:hypothetical protein
MHVLDTLITCPVSARRRVEFLSLHLLQIYNYISDNQKFSYGKKY